MKKKLISFLLLLSLVICIPYISNETAFATVDVEEGIVTNGNFPMKLIFMNATDVSYNEATGFTVTIPNNKSYELMKIESADPAVKDITVKLAYYKKLNDEKRTEISIPINSEEYTKLNSFMGFVDYKSTKEAFLVVTQGEKIDEYKIKFEHKATLYFGAEGLKVVDSNNNELGLNPEPAFSTVYAYDVFGIPSDGKVKITPRLMRKQETQCNIDNESLEDLKDKEITLNWSEDKSSTVNLNVTGNAANPQVQPTTYTLNLYQKVEELKIINPPTSTAYVTGDAFDASGMVVKAKFADGTEKEITDYSIYPEGGLTTGTESVTLRYRGAETTCAISVSNAFEEKGTQDDPYLISTQEDLIRLSRAVGNGLAYAGSYFKMTEDITLPQNWTPIGSESADGNYHNFCGIFDGGMHTLTIPAGEKPLFGYVAKAELRNLKIYGEQINGFGVVNNYRIGSGINIDNVTLLSGTKTLKSGFIGGYASGADVILITNCTVEKNVIIGYTGTESNIGSFGGDFNGKIINCKSSATVKGRDFVGGIVGNKGQTMKGNTSEPPEYHMINCEFNGEVIATGKYAGGIAGGGYGGTFWGIASAPNTPCSTIQDCLVTGTVTGGNYVGGILGAEPGVVQCWENGIGYIQNNLFTGHVNATDGSYVGGIIGYINSLNKCNVITNNYYIDNCGTNNGIGGTSLVDTNYPKPDKTDSSIKYINTSEGVDGYNVYGLTKPNLNRNDDPVGTDASELAKKINSKSLLDASVVTLLNTGENSTHKWIQGKTQPEQSREAVLYKLTIDNIKKTTYYVGEQLNIADALIKGIYSNGNQVDLTLADVTIEGFESSKIGVKIVKIKKGIAEASFEVTVLSQSPRPLEAFITIYGDYIHDSDADGVVHTLRGGNLRTWVTRTSVRLDQNKTVKDALEKVARDNNIEIKADPASKYGYYVQGMTKEGTYIGEFTNGRLTGWMYTVNGKHPEMSAQYYYLSDNDDIIWHYTDDYTKEEGSDKWGVPGADEVKAVTTSGASGSATTTAPTEVKVSGSTATATIKAENQSEILKQAAEKKSAEIVLEVAASDTKGAENVQLQLETSFVKSISDKTNASLILNTENGRVSFDQEALKAIISEAKGSTIIIEIAKVSKPTEAQKKAAGTNGDIFRLLVKSGDKIISDFNKGKATVRMEIPAKLADKKVAAIYIADDAKSEQLAGRTLTIGGKKFYEFTTPHFSAFALVDAEELGLEVEEPQVDAKALTAKLTPIARSAKTAKKNVKVTVSLDKQDKAMIKELKDAGYTVKYRFYRSTKKAAGYKAAVMKKTASYTNTSGKKGTKYFYKVQVRVYDENGKLVAKTALKQCKYATRTWSKAK